MSVRVIIPPAAIVSPADIAGNHQPDDVAVARKISAATRTIDGPSGWLGRALGKQTLELVATCWRDRSFRLPYPPLIGIVSVKYVDATGVEQTIDPALYGRAGELLWFKPSFSAPAIAVVPEPIRVRFEAGYNGNSVADGGTGPIPDEAKEAIILMTQDLIRNSGINAGVRSETVDGVGSTTYLDTDKVSAIALQAADRLLAGLRVYSL